MNNCSLGDADHNPDFNALVAKYEKKIYNVIYRYLGNEEMAADLTQQTFTIALRRYDDLQGDSKLFTRLYQIARNLCINHLRGGRKASQRAVSGATLEASSTPSSADSGSRLDKEEMRRRVSAAIEEIPSSYRQILRLRYLEDCSHEQIAEATGLQMDEVKFRLSRARSMLRQQLSSSIQ